MPKHIVKSPINYDGEPHRIGDIVDIKDKDARALLDVGAIAPVPAEQPAEKKTGGEKKKAE